MRPLKWHRALFDTGLKKGDFDSLPFEIEAIIIDYCLDLEQVLRKYFYKQKEKKWRLLIDLRATGYSIQLASHTKKIAIDTYFNNEWHFQYLIPFRNELIITNKHHINWSPSRSDRVIIHLDNGKSLIYYNEVVPADNENGYELKCIGIKEVRNTERLYFLE